MKAWQIYLISVLVISFPGIAILNNFGYESGEGIDVDMGSATFTTSVIGGIVTGIYYVIKWSKEERKENLKTPIS